MSRHNRRRTRGGYRPSSSSSSLSPFSSQISDQNNYTHSTSFLPCLTGNPIAQQTSRSSSGSNSSSSSSSSSGPGSGFGMGMGRSSSNFGLTLNSYSNSMNTYRTGVSARHWHNRYMAWQTREKRQREEHARLEEEKRRIFGIAWDKIGAGSEAGEADDEDGLCEKMLEYFGGLDFIE